MPKGFTGIRLLLVFVAVNTILFAMLVTAMTSDRPWLANFLPGSFATGASGTGYWVFFALVLLVNAVTVLLAGFVMVLPALFAGPLDPARVTRLLERTGVADDTKDACIAAANEEAAAARSQIAVGRAILIAGGVFLVLAFASVTITTVHALPYDQMFENDDGPVDNARIQNEQVWRFAADQIAGALALDIPEIYDWHFGDLVNATASRLFTDFVFAFRALLGWVGLTTAMTLLRGLGTGGRKKKAAAHKP
ncbi:MAG: hypothetical protein ACREHE_02270 [Rhizomicrobium sp.]